jgi:hypothetical protein
LPNGGVTGGSFIVVPHLSKPIGNVDKVLLLEDPVVVIIENIEVVDLLDSLQFGHHTEGLFGRDDEKTCFCPRGHVQRRAESRGCGVVVDWFM